MVLKRALSILSFVFAGLIGLLWIYFAVAGMFGLRTMSYLGFSAVLSFIMASFTTERFRKWFLETQNFKFAVYIVLIAVVMFIAVTSLLLGISSGGVDYTQHMAQNT